MQLTDQQISYFHTFGFIGFPQLFAPDEIGWITEGFEDVIRTYGGGEQHDGSKRTIILPIIDHNARLCTLLDDQRIVGIASSILGDDFNYASGDGNYYTGETSWHSDGQHPDLFAIKIALYLDSTAHDTGCLRVIPGSHLLGDQFADALQERVRDSEELWGIHGREVPAVSLESEPGDVLVFNHNIKHSSFGGGARRRMFALNFVRHGKTEEEVARLDDYLRAHSPLSSGFDIGGMYAALMMGTAGAQRMSHLTQMNERHAVVYPDRARR